MMLKFVHADERASSEGGLVDCLSRGRFEPAVHTLVDGVARCQWGGPIKATPVPGEEWVPSDSDQVRHAVVRYAAHAVPNEPSSCGWADVIDCTARSGEAPDVGGDVWWVIAHMRDLGQRGEVQSYLFIHDTRAYLCDDEGSTIERLGPI